MYGLHYKKIFKALFDPSWNQGTLKLKLFHSCLLFTWLTIVIVAVIHHEYWRDEVRALSLALDAPMWWNIPGFIKNEGHPALWYWLLRGAHSIFGIKLTLPILSITISTLAVGLFIFNAPFNNAIKIFFTFSILPLYEYSVMSRNYGISMLLMFCIASLYKMRREHFFLLAICIALLANTNLSALIASASLTLILLWDSLIEDQSDLRGREGVIIFSGIGLIIAAILFALVTIKPDDNTLLTNAHHIKSPAEYWASIRPALTHSGTALKTIMPIQSDMSNRLIAEILIWIMIAGLLFKPIAAISLYLAVFITAFITYFSYPLALRHHGIILCLILTLYWIGEFSETRNLSAIKKTLKNMALVAAIPLVLLWNDGKAYTILKNDYKNEASSSKALGQWINQHAEYQNSILIVEPDYIFESIPYYANIKLFIPREEIFRQYGKSTKEQKQTLTLGELLNQAKNLSSQKNKPILIGLGISPMELKNEKYKNFPYGRVFSWTKKDLKDLNESTQFVGSFDNTYSDEKFYIYALKKPN